MFELIVTAARELGQPTQGEFAVKLWELCSGNRLRVDEAKRLYEACGYEAFCGYPLTRLRVGQRDKVA
jgi:hypothetical protein